jgi:glutathione S-transferase
MLRFALRPLASVLPPSAVKAGAAPLRALSSPAAPAVTAPPVPAGAALTLFAHQICPFCCKAKGVMRARGVPFHVVEVNPLTKAQIKWSTGYSKVPIAAFSDGEVSGPIDRGFGSVNSGWSRRSNARRSLRDPSNRSLPLRGRLVQVVNDSAAIVDTILARTADDAADDGFASADARKWAAWATDELAPFMCDAPRDRARGPRSNGSNGERRVTRVRGVLPVATGSRTSQ